MARYEWTMEFVDKRVCAVEANCIDEAIIKMNNGDWVSEDTVDFYARELLEELHRVS